MKNRPLTRLVAAGLALTLLGAAACSDDDGDDTSTDDSTTTVADDGGTGGDGGSGEGTPLDAEQAEAVATTYADLAFAVYGDAVTAATDLQTALDAFVADPTEATLQAARDVWLTSHRTYGPSEVFRFYDGPIDDADDGPEGRINAWPLDEAYVDYTEDDPAAGLIADTDTLPEIAPDSIAATNEQGGETNVSTGWHAIEFLLWGQDSDPAAPGARPVTDYTTAENADRRSEYLAALAQLLVDDLTSVRDEWSPEGGAYREEFIGDPDQAVTNILRGMGALSSGELAGERMLVAYDTQDQEDEHSCFSDSTLADLAANAQGIRMAYTADAEGVEGTSLQDAVAEVNPELGTRLSEALDASVTAVEALPDLGTFEQIIADDANREQMRAVAEELQAQGDIVAELAGALGYEISLEI